MYLESNMEKLKKRKKELGWTNQKLAEESQVPVGTVNKIFSGATKYPRQETIDALVKALGMDYYNIEDFGAGVSIIRETTAYMPARKDTRATLETYYALPQDTRAELIDGEIYYMSAPTGNHQLLIVEFSAIFRDYLRKKKSECKVFAAPYDVCLDNDDFTMVQPDIVVICDRTKYKDGIRCNGAPDFVIEIVSPSNPKHDYFLKLQKYQKAGVKEYWIVDPVKWRVIVYVFEKDTVPGVYTFEDKIRPALYPDLEIDFAEIREVLI